MDLFENPFHILRASSRDNRQQIVELCDERSLSADPNKCAQARSDLMNPRKRLSAEVSWLPGLAQKRVNEVLLLLDGSMSNLLKVGRLSPLARSNLIAAGLVHLAAGSPLELVDWIRELATAFESIERNKLITVINEDRLISGFPEVSDDSTVESEIQNKRLDYRKAISLSLNRYSDENRVFIVTRLVESTTDQGNKPGPVLIDDLVDSYEFDHKSLLDNEIQTIEKHIEELTRAVEQKQTNRILSQLIDQLVKMVESWEVVARPIQVSKKGRGLSHDESETLAGLVRSLAVKLFNEYGMLEASQRLTILLQNTFVHVLDIAEWTAKDVSTLNDIANNQKRNELLGPILDVCKSAMDKSEQDPSTAVIEAQHVIKIAPQLFQKMIDAEAPNDILEQGRDDLSFVLMQCAIVYGNKTNKWAQCIPVLEHSLGYATSQEAKDRIQKNLGIARNNEKLFGNLKPISSAPSLSTINGMGFRLYGSSDFDKGSGSYFSTYYFVFFFIPIFPIRRYRVIPTSGGYKFLGKAPLRILDKGHLLLSLCLSLFLFYSVISSESGVQSYPSGGTTTDPQNEPIPGQVSAPNRYSSPQSDYNSDRASAANEMRHEIEKEKSQVKELELRIRGLDSQLESLSDRMQTDKTLGMIDDYNTIVPRYNSLISDRDVLYQRYKLLLDDVNAKVDSYNTTYVNPY